MTFKLNKSLSLFLLASLIMYVLLPNILLAQESKVRIIKENAVVRLKPNSESVVIRNLPLGAEFKIKGTIGEWIILELPPDEDGIIIVGYVHKSFVEYESNHLNVKKSNKLIPVEKSIRSEPKDGARMSEQMLWERELQNAKSKRSTGTILTISGVLVCATFTVLTFIFPSKEWGFLNITYQERPNTGYLVGAAIGLTTAIVGLAILIPASKSVKKLENEGREKGYIKLGLLPKYKAVGIQICFSF